MHIVYGLFDVNKVTLEECVCTEHVVYTVIDLHQCIYWDIMTMHR